MIQLEYQIVFIIRLRAKIINQKEKRFPSFLLFFGFVGFLLASHPRPHLLTFFTYSIHSPKIDCIFFASMRAIFLLREYISSRSRQHGQITSQRGRKISRAQSLHNTCSSWQERLTTVFSSKHTTQVPCFSAHLLFLKRVSISLIARSRTFDIVVCIEICSRLTII